MAFLDLAEYENFIFDCLRSFLPRSFLSVLSRLERGGEFSMSNRLDPPRGVSQLGRKNSPLGNPDVSPSNLVEGARLRRQGQRVNVVREPPSSRSSDPYAELTTLHLAEGLF